MNALAIARQLRHHAARRAQGLATLSVVESTVYSALAALGPRVWVDQRAGSSELLAARIVDALEESSHVEDVALHLVERAEGLPRAGRAHLDARSASEQTRWLEGVALRHADETVQSAARWLMGQLTLSERPASALDALALLLRFLPDDALPAVVARCEHAAELEPYARLALALPRLPMVAVVERLVEGDSLDALSDRSRSLVRAGLVAGAARSPYVDHTGGQSAANDTAAQQPMEALLDAAACARAAVARGSSDAEAQCGRARSLAEAYLFGLLEAEPDTRGLFSVNRRLHVPFGNARAEVDLLGSALSIAIEIDGYFHFTGPDAYRRDRRKDLLMQRAGLLVVRFLADDVIADGHAVVRVIRELVREKRSPTTARITP